MKKTLHIFKKIIIAAVGIPIVILGIILIPLPGPGLLVVLLGLFILSFGFESVKKHLDRYLDKLKKIYKDAKKRQQDFIDKHQ